MKHTSFILFAALFFLGCRKDSQPSGRDYLKTAKLSLRDSLLPTDFNSLDFLRATRLKVDSTGFFALRVPFKDKGKGEDFLFIKTNEKGQIERGRIVHLEGKVTDEGTGIIKRKRWDGAISLASLNRKTVFSSAIVDGCIVGYHSPNPYRTALQEPQGDVMPEVIITYTITADSEYSWASWFYLESLFTNGGNSGGGESSGYYGSFEGGGDGNIGNGGGGGETVTGGETFDPVIHIDLEPQDERDEINIQQYVKCFSSIPDAGSICSIEIYSDIPVDDSPTTFFNFSTGSPGHTFVSISKSNGTQHVRQNIGFYPKSGYKSMTYAPTAGKLVDNAYHEFNASLYMSISPSQLNTVLIRMQQLSNLNYDVDSYNCTDWALDIFNSVRIPKLEIPLYGIPGSQMT